MRSEVIMPALVDESKTRCLENRRLLADTRVRVASSRRLLNPGWGISGASDETLRQAIRRRLATGSLLPIDGKVCAGKATGGKRCTLCGMPIPEGEIEHEVVGPTTVFTH
jgi:hypothetical protein